MDPGNLSGRSMQSSDDDDGDEEECYDQSSYSSMAHPSTHESLLLPPTTAFFLINPSMSNPHDLLFQQYSLLPGTYDGAHGSLRVVSPRVCPESSTYIFKPLPPGSHHIDTTSFTDFGYVHAPMTLSSGGLHAGAVRAPNPGRDISMSHSRAQVDQMNAVIIRNNPKKRARASRRAPTTVLTTDTTNFRLMVQEFTGIPEPPFSGSSSFARRRNLFLGSGSGLRSGGHLGETGSMAMYHIRPLPQKISSVASSFPTSSSALQNNIDLISSAAVACNTAKTSSMAQKIVPHPALDFQSFLQPQQNMAIPSAFAEVAIGEGNPNASSRAGLSGHNGLHDLQNIDQRPSGSNVNMSQWITSCKLNYSTTSLSEARYDKGLGNIASSSTGEGITVDCWICPSE